MNYPSDLTDEQWQLIKRYFNTFNHTHTLKHSKRELIDAVLCVTKTGCQWRQLPHDFPSWKTVYSFFRRAKQDGTWSLMMRALVGKNRQQSGRSPLPTHGIIDSQSAKTTGPAEHKGFDGGKKVKGRKRHIVTDTLGHILHVRVHGANDHDSKSGCIVFREAVYLYPSLNGVCGDAGYRGTFEKYVSWVLQRVVDIKERIADSPFKILAKRWIVERAFAWLNHFRRLAKDYETTCSSEETFIRIAHSMFFC